MGKPKEIVRIFSVPDSDMLEAGTTMHNLFTGDKQAFANFDTDFADPFAENWMNILNTALETPVDDYVKNELGEYTAEVEKCMEACREGYRELKYFYQKAFPEDRKTWNLFGYSVYEKKRNSETKMLEFLPVIKKAAAKYSAQLIQAGYSQEKIDNLETLRLNLFTANSDQEFYRENRPKETRERIVQLNKCYEFMQKVNKAAKIVFKDDFVKYEQYMLPSENVTSTGEEPGSNES